jgi:hypothetical protein
MKSAVRYILQRVKRTVGFHSVDLKPIL